MTLVLDAGAFVAVERRDNDVATRIKRELLASRRPVTHGGVIGQVWRGGTGRNTAIARIVPGIDVAPLDGELGKQAGALLASAGGSDVIDAAVLLLAQDFDRILTSDPHDLAVLADAAGIDVEIVEV